MSQNNELHTPKTLPNGPVVMALTLDRERNQERILIGEETSLRAYLEGKSSAQVIYDETLPLGSFLSFHEAQRAENWDDGSVSWLKEALSSLIRRKDREQKTWQILTEKQNYHDPLSVYVTCQRWGGYVRNRAALGTAKNAEAFETQMMELVQTFRQSLWDDKQNYTAEEILENARRLGDGIRADGQGRLWYPGPRRDREYLILDGSLYPAILYCVNHLHLWGYCFCRCVNCGKMFAASSKHYSLCSEECKKEKNRRNKRDFDQRARRNKYDVEYKNVSQRMRNRLNSLRHRTDLPEEELDLAEEMFAEFRRDAVARKKQICSDADCDAFRDWMADQEQRFSLFCDG